MPAPGKPSWPRIAASAISAQNGCSPFSARCSAQLAVKSVRFPMSDSASATIASAEIPVSGAAHAGDFGIPSVRPATYAKNRSPPVQ